jgi:DtxR family Mn-dependent transcriptional regulator
MTHSINQFWREFDDTEITHSIAHYLLSIDALLSEKGYARGVDIANALSITAGSCSIGLKSLQKKWYIQEDESKFISLSTTGKTIVSTVLWNRDILSRFFMTKLGLPRDIATTNACKIEHLIDSEVVDGMAKLLKI